MWATDKLTHFPWPAILQTIKQLTETKKKQSQVLFRLILILQSKRNLWTWAKGHRLYAEYLVKCIEEDALIAKSRCILTRLLFENLDEWDHWFWNMLKVYLFLVTLAFHLLSLRCLMFSLCFEVLDGSLENVNFYAIFSDGKANFSDKHVKISIIGNSIK